MTLRPPEETFVRTSAELTELWRAMMGPGGFAVRSIWHIFFEVDGQMNPLVVPIDDIPAEPDALLLSNLAETMRGVSRNIRAASLAVLLSRPGPAHRTPADRRWAIALRDAFGSSLCPWPVHLATRGRVQIFAPDDLIAA